MDLGDVDGKGVNWIELVAVVGFVP